jgi:hypothetical protein
MRGNLLAAAFVCFVPAVALAGDQPVQVWAGQPGPYEVHTYVHRTNSFDRAPYFATHPPVYYSADRLGRMYGWTPYPFLGTQYPVAKAVSPLPTRENEKLLPPRNKKVK